MYSFFPKCRSYKLLLTERDVTHFWRNSFFTYSPPSVQLASKIYSFPFPLSVSQHESGLHFVILVKPSALIGETSAVQLPAPEQGATERSRAGPSTSLPSATPQRGTARRLPGTQRERTDGRRVHVIVSARTLLCSWALDATADPCREKKSASSGQRGSKHRRGARPLSDGGEGRRR